MTRHFCLLPIVSIGCCAVVSLTLGALAAGVRAAERQPVEANRMAEETLESEKSYSNPFMDVELEAVVTRPDGTQLRVPAFWAGGNRWCFRYASGQLGRHAWRTECSDKTNAKLQAIEGEIDVVAYAGENPLYRHGPIRIADDRRHFAHADGTPFLWLGDTWWKGLCKRLTWEGFRELAADRKAKGFTVVQIVCGVYPDEGLFEPRWENEGGMPYLAKDFSVVNPQYFEYADRRIEHLAEAGIAPAIVGGWGRSDCNGMLVGIDGVKRHWRNLIARYGAHPVIWIIGGESSGPEWTEVAKYVQEIDPYRHPSTMHPHDSGRKSVTDETAIDFDMLQTGHGDWDAARAAIPKLTAACDRQPPMPVMIGEYCYEGHMQTAFQDVQRYVFWSSMLSGSAGLTYGAAGVWHASVDGDPGIANIYDWTTWREGMNFPGSTQLGLGKQLLEHYPWWRFEPHPEWVEPGCFAAGIPGEVRFIYLPRRGVYNWSGPVVKELERDVPYSLFYLNPTNGKRYDEGIVVNIGPPSKIFEDSSLSRLFEDRFENAASPAWKDCGTPTQRKDGRLVGGKGMTTVLETITDADLMAGVDANSNAEAGVILRFHDADNYLVALYSPLLKAIFLHDRKNGNWGASLGKVDVPEIGPRIRLTAAACGNYAAMALTDGQQTYYTPIVKVDNAAPGKSGLWLYQIGERQEFGNFELSKAEFVPGIRELNNSEDYQPCSDVLEAPRLPSPQDWVLVLERVAP
ncbi:MAG: apiosidase-like domain-containing protein [Pirellulaceae bacterium]